MSAPFTAGERVRFWDYDIRGRRVDRYRAVYTVAGCDESRSQSGWLVFVVPPAACASCDQVGDWPLGRWDSSYFKPAGEVPASLVERLTVERDAALARLAELEAEES